MNRDNYILWFDQLHRDDVDLAGGKSSSLGELTSETNVPVPYGFATTAIAFRHFMNYSDLNQKIDKLLATLTDPEDSEQLHRICTTFSKLMIEAPMPNDLALEIS